MPEDYEERKKLETPMAPAIPCKTCKKNKHGETRTKTTDFKSKLACILEASESTRLRMEESLPNYHEDHIAGQGDNSLQHTRVDRHVQNIQNRSSTRAPQSCNQTDLPISPCADVLAVFQRESLICASNRVHLR